MKGLMIKRGDRVKLIVRAAAAFKKAATGRRTQRHKPVKFLYDPTIAKGIKHMTKFAIVATIGAS